MLRLPIGRRLFLPPLAMVALLGFVASAHARHTRSADTPKDPLWSAERIDKMVKAYHEALGDKIRVLDLKIYSNRAQLQAQDPSKPENVEQYDYRGRVSDPIPVHLSGHGRLEDNLFGFDEVAFDRIPGLVDEALKRVPLEGQEVTHIFVKRNLPFSKEVRILIYVNGTRQNGRIEADAQGQVVKTVLPREH